MADSPDLDNTREMPAPTPATFARYRLKAELGRGGMGVVWRAEDTKLQRDVALKFLPEVVVRDREAMADLAAETRRCLELTHPHIVRVYDLVEDGARAAISMELVEGGSLAERKLAQPDRCFAPAAIAPWIAQLCAALDYAHTRIHLVHRDLKPLNLLLSAADELKVVDFGIARSLVQSGTRLSGAGKSASLSLGYAGPQQLLGEPPAVTDDIYALGATVYELLTGKPPFFEGDIITQLREVVPPTLAARRAAFGITGREDIPAEWEETIAACLAKRAEDRPQSAAEVAARLGFPLAGANRTAVGTKAARSSSAAGRWVAAVAALVVCGGLVVLWPRWAQSKAPSAPVAQPSAPAVPAAPAPAFLVRVSPPDVGARVWLGPIADRAAPDDGRLALTGVPDGEHELMVQASGYKSTRAKVRVAGGRGAAEIALEPVFGRVVVVGRPGTVVTAVNERGREKALGTIPAKGQLAVDDVLTVGTYLFRLRHADCVDAEQATVSVSTGRQVRVAPPQVQAPAELRVFSVPDGAEVLVNGQKSGVTPATLPGQPSGKPLSVEIVLAGHKRVVRNVNLTPREVRLLDFGTLPPENGVIELRFVTPGLDPAAVKVKVDGQARDLKNGPLNRLESGSHAVEIVHADYQPWTQAVTVSDKAPVRVDVKLVPKDGEVTLNVTGPAAYTLTVNGKPVTVPRSQRLPLPAGEELKLEFAARGFRSGHVVLTLPPNGRKTIPVALEKIPAAEPGQPWTVPEIGLTLLPLAPGEFAMGSERGELSERPITQVRFTKPCWLGKHEVTQREWTALMGSNPSKFQGDKLPVENVTWLEAAAFCTKLTERERAAGRLPAGYVYSLPSEAQWEYAARAGETGDVPAGIAEAAWHEQNSAQATHPVASLAANAWGFHDMLGNVWEWCADGYTAKLRGGMVVDPKPANGADRVRRGGSFSLKPSFLRFGNRGKGEPEFRWFNIGFRVALVPGS